MDKKEIRLLIDAMVNRRKVKKVDQKIVISSKQGQITINVGDVELKDIEALVKEEIKAYIKEAEYSMPLLIKIMKFYVLTKLGLYKVN